MKRISLKTLLFPQASPHWRQNTICWQGSQLLSCLPISGQCRKFLWNPNPSISVYPLVTLPPSSLNRIKLSQIKMQYFQSVSSFQFRGCMLLSYKFAPMNRYTVTLEYLHISQSNGSWNSIAPSYVMEHHPFFMGLIYLVKTQSFRQTLWQHWIRVCWQLEADAAANESRSVLLKGFSYVNHAMDLTTDNDKM